MTRNMPPSIPAFRVRATICTGNRRRFAGLPPQASVRRLVRGARNWLSR